MHAPHCTFIKTVWMSKAGSLIFSHCRFTISPQSISNYRSMKRFCVQQMGQKYWLILLVFCTQCLTTAKSIKEESDGKQFVPKQPQFVERGGVREFQKGSANQRLNCTVTGESIPHITWETPPTLSKNNSMYGSKGDYLEFLIVDESVEGNYTCITSNRFGSDMIKFQVKAVAVADPEETSITATIVYSVLGVLLAVLIIIAVIFIIKYIRTKKKLRDLTKEEVKEFLEGSSYPESGSLYAMRPFQKIINKIHLSIDKTSLLGKGAFGQVFKGTFHGETVAVKTVGRDTEVVVFKAILDEAKLMDGIGEHGNIVKFFGAEVSNIRERELWIVLEYSPEGCLHKYLQVAQTTAALRRLSGNDPAYPSLEMVQAVVRIREETMIYWCEQIACAMHHLEGLKVIHGDLATRNVLLFEDDVVKIADFGLSKRLHEESIYQKKTRITVPWRWIALESLVSLEYSHKSDVWSFGVTAWEIFTFGMVPYNEMLDSDQPLFVQRLKNGLRLERPKTASDEMLGKSHCYLTNKRTSETLNTGSNIPWIVMTIPVHTNPIGIAPLLIMWS